MNGRKLRKDAEALPPFTPSLPPPPPQSKQKEISFMPISVCPSWDKRGEGRGGPSSTVGQKDERGRPGEEEGWAEIEGWRE